ncbi:MAG TPA: polysaccharide deacetylase family protein, partial [Mycobacterium sp.]
MPKRPDSQRWRYARTVLGVLAAAAVLVVGGLTGHVRKANAEDVDCSKVKCVALTFDDGPSPYTDRLLQILKDNDAKSTFFLIGNKVAANPAGAKRIADAGMEVANHTWEHPNMAAIPPEDIAGQISKANDAIQAATGQRPTLLRTAGGLINDNVLAAAKQQGMADINWDVIPFDW